MKRIVRKLLIILFLSCLAPLFSQNNAKGAVLDPVRYEQTEAKPLLLARSYSSLPRSVSLKQYSPIPGNQGNFGTCTAWSTAFAARTISESFSLKRTDRTATSSEVFSPAHIYKNISNDPECQRGTSIYAALALMKNEGAVKRLPIESQIDFRDILLDFYSSSKRYPIADFVRLSSNDASGSNDKLVLNVKKSLSEGKPVIIGMYCPVSFEIAGYYGDVWEPDEEFGNYGGHAMCVVGYDDSKYGGAFEVQNSWGPDWGDNGYIWIRYSDFSVWVREAYEMIEILSGFTDTVQFSSSIEIDVYSPAGNMPVSFDRSGFYKSLTVYPAGTGFQYLMTNKEPSYVYAFSADNFSGSVDRIFPSSGVSPILDYTDSTIAWPSDDEWLHLDNAPGTDYLIVLYSKVALDINAIQRRFAAAQGSFPQRTAIAVGPDFIPYNQANYSANKIEFSAQSSNPKAVFGLLLAIEHR